MGGFCGWSYSGPGRGGPIEAVDKMAAHCGRLRMDVPGTVLGNTSVLTGRSGTVPVETRQVGRFSVAAEGRLRWRAGKYESLARSDGHCAALARAYEEEGARCLDQLEGSFAFAVLDERGNGLLAVDRMGIRPLCYAQLPGLLVFGSAAEAVAAHPRVGMAVSRQAIYNYLFCHVVPSPGTIYAEVRKLQPAECLILRNGTADRRFYWQMRYTEQAPQAMGAMQQKFRRLLRDCAARAVDGQDEVGAFLSGGTDSSTVTGLLTELKGRPARTYSIGFRAEGFDEMAYARVTARHFGANAREYYVTPEDVTHVIPLVAAAYDEPFGNASAVPTYLCARMAREEGVQVMLAGDGGDEIFGGNARYAMQRVFEWYWLLPPWLRTHALEPLLHTGGESIAPWRKMKNYLRQAAIPLPERLETYNFLRRTPLDEIFEPEFLGQVETEEPLVLQRASFERAQAVSYVDRMMHLDLKFTLADNDLRKVTRMCEAAGVEVRYPLIDDALVAFSGELPAEWKVRRLTLRYFFKRALSDFLPPATIAKKKHGFGLPFGLWLREHQPLKALVRDSFLAFEHRGIMKPSYLRSLLTQHETGHATYYGVMIWVVMMLEQWLATRRL